MFRKPFLLVIGLIVITLSLVFGNVANSALETLLLVDVSPSTDKVPFRQTQWYGFSASAGKGYCAILSPFTGNGELVFFDSYFNRVGYSLNPGTTQDKVWYGQESSGPMHIAGYGAANPSSYYTIQVITAPYVKTIDPNAGDVGTLVTLTGFGFGDSRGTNYVKFGSVQATSYSSWTNTEIKVYAPSGIASGVIQVVAYVASRASNPVNFTASAASSDGTMWQYDLARTGNYPNGPTTLPLNVKWTFYSGSYGPLTIANGVIYFGSGKLYALDANTGVLKWSYSGGAYNPVAVAGNTVYFGTNNTFYALDATTSTLKWKYVDPYGGTIYSTPAVLNGIVYFSTDQRFYALDANTGVLRWSYIPSGKIYYSFAIANGVIYFGDSSVFPAKIYALYANNGAVKWTYTMTNYSIDSTPVIASGTLYFGAAWSGEKTIFALDANTGTVKWQNRYNTYYSNYLAIANGVLYTSSIFSGCGGIFAWDANTGVAKWSLYQDSPISAPIISGGNLFIQDENIINGAIYVLDANTGSVKWSYSLMGSGTLGGRYKSSVIYNGKLYVSSGDGKLYCFGQ